MSKVRFYRVESLPQEGVLGGLYFVTGDQNKGIWVCNPDGEFEQYGITDLSQMSVDIMSETDIDDLFIEIEE